MIKKDIRDLKFIMKTLRKSKKKNIDLPELEDLETKIINQIEIRKLKREISILKRLEYALILGIFFLFILFFPRGIKDRVEGPYSTNSNIPSGMEGMFYEVQEEIRFYLSEEYEFDFLGLENLILDYEETY